MADPEPVHAVAPDGRQVEIKPDKVREAADAGYRLQTPEQFQAAELERQEGLAGAAKAFGQSALGTATLGGSDVVGGWLGGDEYRQKRSLREIAFPTATGAGEAAGMLAPALIPGAGEAALAREGAEGASALSRAAGAVGGALRYSPAGVVARGGELAGELAGRGLEHIGLGGESLLGRTVAAGARSAVSGAVEGGAFGAGGGLSEAALAPDGNYDDLAQKLWAGAIHGAEFGAALGGGLGAGGELATAAARKIGGTFGASKAIRELADTKSLKSAGWTREEAERLVQEEPERARAVADTIRDQKEIGVTDSLATRSKKLETARDNANEALGTFRKQLDEQRAPGQGVDVAGALEDATARVEDLKASARTDAQREAAGAFEKEVRSLREKVADGERASFEQAHDFRQALEDKLSAATNPKNPYDIFDQRLKELRTDLHNHFETATEQAMGDVSPEFRQQYADAKARHSALEEASSMSKGRVSELAAAKDAMSPAERVASLAQTGMGLAHFAAMGPKGMLMAAANRALKTTQADAIVGLLANELTKLDSSVASSVSRWAAQSRKAATETTGAAQRLGEATKKTIGSGTHATAHARETYETREEQTRGYFEKLHAVEQEAKSAPGTLVHIPNAPKTAEAAERVRREQANWLLSQAPKPPAQIKNPMLARIARQTPPTTVDMLKWMRKVKTIEDPKSALDALERGRLTTDHVEALKQMPAVLKMFRRAATEQVTEHNADMSYQARIQLGVLLGVTTDPSLRPESIAAGQAVYAKNRQPPPQPQQSAQPVQSIPGKRPTGFDSSLDQMEANTGKV